MTEALTSKDLLEPTLMIAVPLWVEKIIREQWSLGMVWETGKKLADVVATKSDAVLYKSKKKGETAEAFNNLALGLACLSFAPGGVKFMGLHFETSPKKLEDKAP